MRLTTYYTIKMTKRSRIRYRYPRFRRRHRSGGMTLPVAPLVGLAIGIAEPINYFMAGNYSDGIKMLGWNYLGITAEGSWNPGGMMRGLLPLIVGCAVHKFVGGKPLNANAMLARAKVPLIRI